MVRAAFDRHDEDQGLLAIDISPSHPRLWRKPLSLHVQSRMRDLSLGGTVELLDDPDEQPELAYEAEQRVAAIGDQLHTAFRVFRQKSRVITVSYTAAPSHFDASLARHLVHLVSESMLIELPVIEAKPPSLATERRTVGDLVSAQLPPGFELRRQRTDLSLVPTEVLELSPPIMEALGDDDRPMLTLSVLRLSLLGPDVEIEGLALPPGGSEIRTGTPTDKRATVIEVDDDTLAALRVVRVGDDVLTITYAAPDYLFEVKPAIGLLDRIATSATVTPLPNN